MQYKSQFTTILLFLLLGNTFLPALTATKKGKAEIQNFIIEDDTATHLKNLKLRKKEYNYKTIKDEPIVMSDEQKNFKKPVYTGVIKTEEGIEITIRPVKKIHTKSSLMKVKNKDKNETYRIALPEIGEKTAFRVVKDIKKDGKIIIEKNTLIYGKVDEVSLRAMGGAPAEMTIGKFEYTDKKGNIIPLSGSIYSCGYSLSLWIGIAELATTPFLFGLAVPALRVLPGGQAVVTPRKKYVVYY